MHVYKQSWPRDLPALSALVVCLMQWVQSDTETFDTNEIRRSGDSRPLYQSVFDGNYSEHSKGHFDNSQFKHYPSKVC